MVLGFGFWGVWVLFFGSWVSELCLGLSKAEGVTRAGVVFEGKGGVGGEEGEKRRGLVFGLREGNLGLAFGVLGLGLRGVSPALNDHFAEHLDCEHHRGRHVLEPAHQAGIAISGTEILLSRPRVYLSPSSLERYTGIPPPDRICS